MNIYINGRFLEEQLSGVGKYAINIINELDKYNNLNITLLSSVKGKYENIKFKNIKIRCVGRLYGNLWEQIELPYYARDGFLISLCNRGAIVKKRQLLTIHDAATEITPDRFPLGFRILLKIIYHVMKNRVSVITTVSKQSRNDIVEMFNIPRNKIKIVHNGLTKIKPDKEIIKRHNLENVRYILSVGGTENKNLEGIVNALSYISSDVKYVSVGKLCEKYCALMRDNNRIIELGYVSDAELFSLYEHAVCLVYPSFYEGFGIPPLEAMSMGCPVIVSDIPVLKEIYGKAVLYCNPYDSEDIGRKINTIMKNVHVKNDLLRECMVCLEKYSWENSTRQLINLIM